MTKYELNLAAAVEDWNKCDISTAQLALLRHHVGITLGVLTAFGESGLLLSGYRQLQDSLDRMADARSGV